MRFLSLLLLSLTLSFSAQAQTPVSKETANSYFDNCAAQPAGESLSADSQNMLCACTAARLTQFFTVEDMQAMADPNRPEARLAVNKMLVEIYAPCMEAPTRDFHYNACITNPDTARYGDPQRICPCMADAVAGHMRNNGPAVFRDILTRNPTIVDPMAALVDDPGFKQFAQSKLLACVR
ncbi:MAG: hypothetical protein WC989_02910 [Micavibrio sp.]